METEGNAAEETASGAEPTMDSLLREQAQFQARLAGGEVVWVRVVQVVDAHVLVDIGEKHEGRIPAADFAGGSLPAAGGRIPAILVGPGRDDRPAQLSHEKARAQLGWEQALKAFGEKSRVRGRVKAAIKGGFLVEVGGVHAFLPASLADLRPVRNPKGMVGTGVRCVILEVNQEKKQLVLSRKAVLEEEAGKRRERLLAKLKPGDILIGRVSHTIPAGVFVNLGGAEGFVPTEELAWKDPQKARAGVAHGQKMRLKVMRVDRETGKITLGVKQLTANPGDALRKKYPAKTVLTGKVSEVTPEGVRVVIAEKVAAWCPAAELATTGQAAEPERDFGRGRGREPKGPPPDAVWPKAGEEVKGLVLGIHPSTFDVTISIRRYEEIQDRKRVAKYLKGSPRLTLGQILTSSEEA